MTPQQADENTHAARPQEPVRTRAPGGNHPERLTEQNCHQQPALSQIDDSENACTSTEKNYMQTDAFYTTLFETGHSAAT